jgi:hypothetical protein
MEGDLSEVPGLNLSSLVKLEPEGGADRVDKRLFEIPGPRNGEIYGYAQGTAPGSPHASPGTTDALDIPPVRYDPFWHENVCQSTEESFEGRIAMKQNHKTYRLVNLEDRSDVIERISKAEEDLNRLINGRVALIAYVKDETE